MEEVNSKMTSLYILLFQRLRVLDHKLVILLSMLLVNLMIWENQYAHFIFFSFKNIKIINWLNIKLKKYAWLNHTFLSSLTCFSVAWLPCKQKVFLLIYWSIVWLQEGTVTGHCWHYWQWNPQITEGGQRNTGYKGLKLGAQLTPRPTLPTHMCHGFPMFGFENKCHRKDTSQQKWAKISIFCPPIYYVHSYSTMKLSFRCSIAQCCIIQSRDLWGKQTSHPTVLSMQEWAALITRLWSQTFLQFWPTCVHKHWVHSTGCSRESSSLCVPVQDVAQGDSPTFPTCPLASIHLCQCIA